MKQLICDNCKKPILNTSVYFTVKLISNDNPHFIDSNEFDICSTCAKNLPIDKIYYM